MEVDMWNITFALGLTAIMLSRIMRNRILPWYGIREVRK
jgi:hypothetical protein